MTQDLHQQHHETPVTPSDHPRRSVRHQRRMDTLTPIPPTHLADPIRKVFSQIPRVHYNEAEVYAPIVKHDSLRLPLAITASMDIELHQFDVKIAFLYGDLEEDLYIPQPEGFIQPGSEDHVCHLLRPLYGLKQASRKWNEKIDSFLKTFGLTRSIADPCIYYYAGVEPNSITLFDL